MSDPNEDIRAAHTRWLEAVNAGDIARLLALTTDDVVFIGPGQAPFGRDAFAAKFSDAHAQLHLHCDSALEEVAVAGDVAFTRSCDALSITPRAGGETMQLAGYRVTLYRRQPDGRWLLARDINTVAPLEK